MRKPGVLAAVCLIGCGGGGSTPVADMAAPPVDLAPQPIDLAMAHDLKVGLGCDPILQNCEMAAPKCTVVDDGSGMNLVTQCVAGGGAGAAGDACTRTNDVIGMDDCGRGLFCSGLGNLVDPPMRRCLEFCRMDADCTSGKCSLLTTAPAFGLCVTACAPFGTDCTNGLDCANLIPAVDGATAFLGCRGVGAQAAGMPCMSDLDCAKDLVCLDPAMTGSGSCFALCDKAHACSAGACTAIPGFANGGGYCK